MRSWHDDDLAHVDSDVLDGMLAACKRERKEREKAAKQAEGNRGR